MVNVPPREVSARFNVLLTEDREHAVEHWTQQLPRLLEPMGVQAFLTRTGREALDLASRLEIHAAVVDLLTPAGDPHQPAGRASYPGGLWLLELLRRLPTYPPVVVVSDGGLSQRQVQRCLNEALRLGAFAVVNRPVEIESLLEVIRRLVDRRYAGGWPTLARPSQSPRRPGGLGPGLTEA
ncbi:MAG TPA: hypothetical protein VF184_01490 [Phycisphaeraceae bacterium]